MRKEKRAVIDGIEAEAAILRSPKAQADLGTSGQTEKIRQAARGNAAVAAYLAVCCYASRLAQDLSAEHQFDGVPTTEPRYSGNAEDFMRCLREAAVREVESCG